MSFELWWTITRIKRPLNFFKYYVCVTLVITIVLSCIPFGFEGYRYMISGVMCWVRGDSVQNGTFWAPLGIAISLGTIFIVLVVWEIYKILKANGRSGFLELQMKPILMILLMYCSFVYLFIFEFYMDKKIDEYYASVDEFFACINNRESSSEECLLPGPNAATMGTYIYFLRIIGIYCFLIYGFSKKAINIWKESIIFDNSLVSVMMSKFTFQKSSGSKVTQTTQVNSTTNGARVSSVMNSSGDSNFSYDDDLGGDANEPDAV